MSEPELLLEHDFVYDSLPLYTSLVEQIAWDERIRALKTASFGQVYNYSGLTYDKVPMQPLLVPIVDALEVKFGYRSNNCLLNFYQEAVSV